MNVKKNLPAARFAFVLVFFFAIHLLPAEALRSPEWGYSLDLPEGYSLADKNGSSRYHFVHQMFPVDLQIALYPLKQFPSSAQALEFVTSQLGSKGRTVSFTWRLRQASIGQLAFPEKAGWILSVELAKKKGYLVMACYTDQKRATELENLIISTLDAVFTDQGSYFEPGPMTSFAWGKEKPITAIFLSGKTRLEVPFNSTDASGNQSVVDREFGLLTAYKDSPLVYEAWKRYYRMIYRDAWSRMEKATFLVQNTVSDDPATCAAQLLGWVQGFKYIRNPDGSDFNNLPDTFISNEGDCDSRALLLIVMLNQMGIDAVLLVSPEYSHAVAAIDCPGEGARFTVGNKKYLIADTTAKVGLGKIAQDMADSSKWFAVTFYAFPQSR